VAVANIPTLLMVLVQLTVGLRWLEEPFVLSRKKGMVDKDTGTFRTLGCRIRWEQPSLS
jgi:4-hydroxyacetophenone monooxygenase